MSMTSEVTATCHAHSAPQTDLLARAPQLHSKYPLPEPTVEGGKTADEILDFGHGVEGSTRPGGISEELLMAMMMDGKQHGHCHVSHPQRSSG